MGFIDSVKQVAKKAWYDTVMPLANEEQRSKRSFKDYFLGSQHAPYAIIVAVANTLRRPPAFIFNFISELLGYGSRELSKNDSVIAQGFSWLVWTFQKLFKGAYLLFQLMISPMESVVSTYKNIQSLELSDRATRTLVFLSTMLHLVAITFTWAILAPISPFLMFLPIGIHAATVATDLLEYDPLDLLDPLDLRTSVNTKQSNVELLLLEDDKETVISKNAPEINTVHGTLFTPYNTTVSPLEPEQVLTQGPS